MLLRQSLSDIIDYFQLEGTADFRVGTFLGDGGEG